MRGNAGHLPGICRAFGGRLTWRCDHLASPWCAGNVLLSLDFFAAREDFLRAC
jgi:hypothetical protein